MSITASQVKEIRQELAIFTLATTLERMKKRGFDTQEIVEKLHEKGIEVKPQTLTKYLTEARRQREGRKTQKKDTPPLASETQTAQQLIAADTPSDAANDEL